MGMLVVVMPCWPFESAHPICTWVLQSRRTSPIKNVLLSPSSISTIFEHQGLEILKKAPLSWPDGALGSAGTQVLSMAAYTGPSGHEQLVGPVPLPFGPSVPV